MQEQQIEQGTTFVFNPEKIDLTPQIVVDGVDLVAFIKEKKLIKTRKGFYEMLNRKNDERMKPSSLANLRLIYDEFAKITDDDIERALKIIGGGPKGDGDNYNKLKQWVIDNDLHFIMSDQKFLYWEDNCEYEAGSYYALRMKDAILRSPDAQDNLANILNELNRTKNASKFSARDDVSSCLYNTNKVIYKQLLDIGLNNEEDLGDRNEVLDTLFETVSGCCPIAKTVLEKSFALMYWNTVNKNLMSLPPTFVIFGEGGTGKSRLFIDFVSLVYGEDNLIIDSSSTANSDFNGHTIGKRFRFINEANAIKQKVKEDLKSSTDSRKSYVHKQKTATMQDNVTMTIISANGLADIADVDGNFAGMDRRYQFCEGKTSFKVKLHEKGIISTPGIDESSDEWASTLETVSKSYLEEALKKHNVARHMLYLCRKYKAELEASGWTVVGQRNPAYDRYVKIYMQGWVTDLVRHLYNNVKPGVCVSLDELYTHYKTWGAGGSESAKMKEEKFYVEVVKKISTHPDLKDYFSYAEARTSTIVNKKKVNVKGVYIKEANYSKLRAKLDDEPEVQEELFFTDEKAVESNKNTFADWKIE